MTKDQYRRNAVECMCLAAQIEDPKDKLQLMLMARAWLKLADFSFRFEDRAQMVAVATQVEAPREE